MIETYATYVWACYGITAAVLALNLWLARRSLNEQLSAARRRMQMQESEKQL